MRPTDVLWWMYGWTYDGLNNFYPYRNLVTLVGDATAPQPGEAILELGCGTGNILADLTARQPHLKVTGYDLSSTMLRQARKKLGPTADLHHGSIDTCIDSAPDAAYDAVVTVNVIYALHNREVLWSQVARVLQPGGRLVVATSTSTGSGTIIREHLEHAPWWRLLYPRLIAVFVIDLLIDSFGNRGAFPFPGEDTLRSELTTAGFDVGPVSRCYGDVDILFVARRT